MSLCIAHESGDPLSWDRNPLGVQLEAGKGRLRVPQRLYLYSLIQRTSYGGAHPVKPIESIQSNHRLLDKSLGQPIQSTQSAHSVIPFNPFSPVNPMGPVLPPY